MRACVRAAILERESVYVDVCSMYVGGVCQGIMTDRQTDKHDRIE